MTIDELLNNFRYQLIEQDNSVPVAKKLAGFKHHGCNITDAAMRHPEYFKAKIDYMTKKHPEKKGVIRRIEEEYYASLRD